MIQSPTILAELPRSLVTGRSKAHAADVYGLDGHKRRKRSELAVAVDGEYINVYDVRYTTYKRSLFTYRMNRSVRRTWSLVMPYLPSPHSLARRTRFVKRQPASVGPTAL